MRATLSKVLKREFEHRLSEAFAAFEKVSLQLPGGSKMYRHPLDERIALYLMLQIAERQDRFNLSIGFGNTDKAPPPTSPNSTEEAIERPGLFRLGILVRKPYRDIWWNVDPEASSSNLAPPMSDGECVARIPALVEDAIRELNLHAVPYFESVARRHATRPFISDLDEKSERM